MFLITSNACNFFYYFNHTKCMKKILLYLSAFIPMYFLVIVKLLLEIINGNLSFNVLNTLMLIMLSILIGLGLLGLYLNIIHNKSKTMKIKVVKVENATDQHFLGYFSLFVLFSLSFDLEFVSMAVVFVFVLILIGIVYINNNLFYINPFLNILGFNFYDVTFIKEGEEEERNIKLFCRGELRENSVQKIKVECDNFSFVDKE